MAGEKKGSRSWSDQENSTVAQVIFLRKELLTLKKLLSFPLKHEVYRMRKTYIYYNMPMLACSIHSDSNYDKNSFQRYLQFRSNGLALYIIR